MVYFFWSFHSASEGTFNFENGAHDVQRVFDYAKQAGLYVIARAGPYVNGETSAGGFALWAANGQMGSTRTSNAGYSIPKTAGREPPLDGVSGAEGRFYTTTFKLDLDTDFDVPIGLQLDAPTNTTAVVQILMNGYQFGHYLPHIGPQTLFPFQPGVINNGENTLSISLWALDAEGARLSPVELVAYGAYRTGFNFDHDWAYLQTGWKDRSQYQ